MLTQLNMWVRLSHYLALTRKKASHVKPMSRAGCEIRPRDRSIRLGIMGLFIVIFYLFLHESLLNDGAWHDPTYRSGGPHHPGLAWATIISGPSTRNLKNEVDFLMMEFQDERDCAHQCKWNQSYEFWTHAIMNHSLDLAP